MSHTIKLQLEWRLGEEIGSGGFSKVYLAQSSEGDEAVLKLIPKDPGADRELLFEDLSGVPNVIPIIDSGEWENQWVLAMPRADKSLRAYLDEHGGRLAPDEALSVLLDLATVLAALESRVVHRDIKPENILLHDDNWCLADFGIARYVEATTAPDTRKFALTPPYAAPEQWRSERATSATDIYATGIVAFEMLAGYRPFPGPQSHNYREQHLNETPSDLFDVSPALRSLIFECLYKAPQARPRPQNITTRLEASMSAVSANAQRLQEAFELDVARKSDQSSKESAAQTEAERRKHLFNAAKESLSAIERALHDEVIANAPSDVRGGASLWPRELNSAKLAMSSIREAPRVSDSNLYQPPFEIIAFSSLSVRIPPTQHGYEGRSHSLWYCDAKEEGVFRWYETAFMVNPIHPERHSVNPFAMSPGDKIYEALSPVIAKYQVAWPFEPVDQGNEDKFVERWIGWFADAALGKLHHPRGMPERDPKGSWRS